MFKEFGTILLFVLASALFFVKGFTDQRVQDKYAAYEPVTFLKEHSEVSGFILVGTDSFLIVKNSAGRVFELSLNSSGERALAAEVKPGSELCMRYQPRYRKVELADQAKCQQV